MNHLIDSYGLFFVCFFSMFIVVGIADHLLRKFKPDLWGAYADYGGKTCEQLERRVAALEAAEKTQTN